MKRAKKVIPKAKEYVRVMYQIECPHCHTYLQGGFNENTIQYKCSHCQNPIIIEWDKVVNVKKLF